MHGRPIGNRHGPFLAYVAVSGVNQFFKGGIIREPALVFCHFPYLTVIALNDIGGIDHTSYIRCEPEVLGKPFPVVLPRLDDNRIFPAPFFIQVKKFRLSGFLAYRAIDMFQVFHESFLVFAAYMFGGVAYMVDDTELHDGIREHALDSIGEAFQHGCHSCAHHRKDGHSSRLQGLHLIYSLTTEQRRHPYLTRLCRL